MQGPSGRTSAVLYNGAMLYQVIKIGSDKKVAYS